MAIFDDKKLSVKKKFAIGIERCNIICIAYFGISFDGVEFFHEPYVFFEGSFHDRVVSKTYIKSL